MLMGGVRLPFDSGKKLSTPSAVISTCRSIHQSIVHSGQLYLLVSDHRGGIGKNLDGFPRISIDECRSFTTVRFGRCLFKWFRSVLPDVVGHVASSFDTIFRQWCRCCSSTPDFSRVFDIRNGAFDRHVAFADIILMAVLAMSVIIGVNMIPMLFTLLFFSQQLSSVAAFIAIFILPVLWITTGHYFSKFLGSPIKEVLLAHVGALLNLLIGLGMWLYLEPESLRVFGKLIDGGPVLT